MKGFRSLFLVALVTLMGACAPGDPIPGAAPAPTVASGAGAQQTAVPQAAPGAPQLAGPGTGAVINHATSLKSGATGVINWGYGPWGETGVVYPKIDPNAQVPMGPGQRELEVHASERLQRGACHNTGRRSAGGHGSGQHPDYDQQCCRQRQGARRTGQGQATY